MKLWRWLTPFTWIKILIKVYFLYMYCTYTKKYTLGIGKSFLKKKSHLLLFLWHLRQNFCQVKIDNISYQICMFLIMTKSLCFDTFFIIKNVCSSISHKKNSENLSLQDFSFFHSNTLIYEPILKKILWMLILWRRNFF